MIPRTFSIAALLGCACVAAAFAEGFQARVVGVTAGDIFQIDRKGKAELVVLYGVVAGPSPLAAKEARRYATEKALNQTVTVRVVERREGMTLVELTLADGANLGQVMLRNGLVRVDTLTAAKDQGLKDLENLAKQERLGLWRSISADPAPAARGKAPPGGADEQLYDRRIRAGYDILEGRSWTDEKGVRTFVLRGNGEKILGFENEAERQVIEGNEAMLAEEERLAEEAAAAQAEADRLAYEEEQQRMQQSPY